MMMKKISAVALGLIVAVSFGTGFASEATTAAKPEAKMYADANLGYAKIDEKVAGADKQDNKGYAYNVNAGMNLSKNIAVEAGYTKYPNEKLGTVKGTENYAIDVAAKGTMALADNYAGFAKVGFARVHHKVDAATEVTSKAGKLHAYTPLLAVGVEDQVSESTKLIATVSTTLKRHEVPAMMMASLGAGFSF
jgi:hypothetical protein